MLLRRGAVDFLVMYKEKKYVQGKVMHWERNTAPLFQES